MEGTDNASTKIVKDTHYGPPQWFESQNGRDYTCKVSGQGIFMDGGAYTAGEAVFHAKQRS